MNDCPGLDSHFDRLYELWEDQTYAEEYEEEEEECDDEEQDWSVIVSSYSLLCQLCYHLRYWQATS